MLRRNGAGPETMESVGREENEVFIGWKGFVKQVGFEPGVKKLKITSGRMQFKTSAASARVHIRS